MSETLPLTLADSLSRRQSLALIAAAAIAPSLRAQPATGWLQLATEAYKGKQDDIFVLPGGELGWYGNGSGKLFATRNGGTSWLKIWEKPGTFIRSLGFIDEKNGFLGNVGTDYYPGVTDKQALYRTGDGGVTWDPVIVKDIPDIAGICGIHILHQKRIFQGTAVGSAIVHAAGRVGGPAILVRSEDSGESWCLIDLSSQAGMILDVCFLDAKTGFVCACSSSDLEQGHALILRTDDGANSWHPVYRGTRPFENCWKISFPTRKGGYATVQSYNDSDPKRLVVKTIDGGRTWSELELTRDPGAQTFGIGFANAKRGWVGTRKSGFETVDGGASWTKVEAIGSAVNKIRVVQTPRGLKAFAIGAQVSRLDL